MSLMPDSYWLIKEKGVKGRRMAKALRMSKKEYRHIRETSGVQKSLDIFFKTVGPKIKYHPA